MFLETPEEPWSRAQQPLASFFTQGAVEAFPSTSTVLRLYTIPGPL